jgi:hypothetical protein
MVSHATRAAKLTLPREHGAIVTLGGAGLAAALLAPHPLAAMAAAVVVAAAFLARGPIDRRVAGLGWRGWDGWALVAIAVVAAVGGWYAGTAVSGAGPLVFLVAAALLGASAVVRRLRRHRAFAVELGGLIFCGAAAGLFALAGGAAAARAAALAAVLAAHAGASAPLVRTELRRRERAHASRGLLTALLLLCAGAGLAAGLGHPVAAVALAPRLAHVIVRSLRGTPTSAPSAAALRETALLTLAVALTAIAL